MSQLKNAARVLKRKLNESGYLDYEEAVRAVISSIEPSDANIEAACLGYWPKYWLTSDMGELERESIRSGMKAAMAAWIAAILKEGETGK